MWYRYRKSHGIPNTLQIFLYMVLPSNRYGYIQCVVVIRKDRFYNALSINRMNLMVCTDFSTMSWKEKDNGMGGEGKNWRLVPNSSYLNSRMIFGTTGGIFDAFRPSKAICKIIKVGSSPFFRWNLPTQIISDSQMKESDYSSLT